MKVIRAYEDIVNIPNTYSLSPRYKVYRNKKAGRGWLQIPVGYAQTLEEAQKMLEQGRLAGLHLNVARA
jgi:hypothetical protein